MFRSCVQFTQVGQPHLAEWSRPVGGPVHSLIMHQYWDTVCGELQVQLHACGPILAGLENNR